MRVAALILALSFPLQAGCAQAADGETPSVSDEEIFRAAGFTETNGAWGKCGDPGTVGYAPGEIVEQGDLNGDGRPDAIITEGSTFCFGMTGYGYTVVSKAADGNWRILEENVGIPRLLETRGAEGWPDIEVGQQGFCFPITRWNGSAYVTNRNEFEGKPC